MTLGCEAPYLGKPWATEWHFFISSRPFVPLICLKRICECFYITLLDDLPDIYVALESAAPLLQLGGRLGLTRGRGLD